MLGAEVGSKTVGPTREALVQDGIDSQEAESHQGDSSDRLWRLLGENPKW